MNDEELSVRHDEKQCVYEHWRPDLGVCFYVGRGTAKRANSLKPKHRNKHHGRVVAKLQKLGYCVEIRVFAGGLSVEEANVIEITRIAHYRRLEHPLVNQTNGGEGLVNPAPEVREKMASRQRGKKASAWVREKMSLAHKGKKLSDHAIACLKARKGEKRRPLTAAERQRKSDALRGIPKSSEIRARMSEGSLRREARRRAERMASS